MLTNSQIELKEKQGSKIHMLEGQGLPGPARLSGLERPGSHGPEDMRESTGLGIRKRGPRLLYLLTL